MKRIYILCLLCLVNFMLMSCGTYENIANNSETTSPTMDVYFTSSPEIIGPTIDIIQEPIPTVSPDTNIEGDRFVGEYNDFDFNDPNLQIKPLEDGTYKIEIGIYKLYYITDCIGRLVDDKIEFSSNWVEGKPLKGTITVDEQGIATVRFVSGLWKYLKSDEDYLYYKSSDKPYDKGVEYNYDR